MNLEPEVLRAIPAIFMRVLGMISLLPLGTSAFHFNRHLLLALAISVFLAPSYPISEACSIYQLCIEFALGVVMTLPCSLMLDATQMFGNLIDTGRGQNLSVIYDPVKGNSSNALGILFSNYTFALLVTGGLFTIIVSAADQSLVIMPIAKLTHINFGSQGQVILQIIAQIISATFSFFLILAVLYVLIDCGILLLGRVLIFHGFVSETFQLKSFSVFVVLVLLIELDLGRVLLDVSLPRPELVRFR